MNSPEFWQGYHSARTGQRSDENPYRFQPSSHKEWHRGYTAFKSENKPK